MTSKLSISAARFNTTFLCSKYSATIRCAPARLRWRTNGAVYVIDVSGGDKIPRKGGPGITQSDLLVINKTDLASAVGADLEVMRRDAELMRGDGPVVFAQVKHGEGVDAILHEIFHAWQHARSVPHTH